MPTGMFGAAAGASAFNKSEKSRNAFVDFIEELRESDPRAFETGFDRRTFDGGANPLQGLESFAVNETIENSAGSFRDQRRALLNQANQVGLEDKVNKAQADAAARSDVDEGVFERRTRGLRLSERQQRGAKRRLSLNRAVNQAATGSRVRQTSAQTARNTFKAGADLEDMSFQQEVAGMTGLANAEGQHRINNANKEAADRAERNGAIGQAVGTVLSVVAIAASSEDWKDKREENPELLAKLKKLRVDKWNYKDDEQEHVGPYAEEFNETFGTEGHEGDKRYINLMDAVGVALGSIKQLDDKVEALAHG